MPITILPETISAKAPINLPLSGLILAGGKSSRMGFDKAQLNFHGINQVMWLHHVLSPFCKEVFVSGSPKNISGEYNFIEDNYDRGGPMNGILSGFNKFPEANWLVVPVDMPNIDQQAIEHLVESRNPEKLATCFIQGSEHIEPFPVILENQAHATLQKRFSEMKESLYEFLKDNPSQKIKTDEDRWFVNVNYPK